MIALARIAPRLTLGWPKRRLLFVFLDDTKAGLTSALDRLNRLYCRHYAAVQAVSTGHSRAFLADHMAPEGSHRVGPTSSTVATVTTMGQAHL